MCGGMIFMCLAQRDKALQTISHEALITYYSWKYDLCKPSLPGSSRRLAPVIKCRRFLSFFQRYIVRDISLT